MKSIDQTLLIVIGIAGVTLISGLVYLLVKRKKLKNHLKKEVEEAFGWMMEKEKERSGLWLGYKMLLARIEYKATNIHDELSNLNFPVEEETREILAFFEPQPRNWFWKLHTRFLYEPDQIPERFFKEPQWTIKKLRKMLKALTELREKQIELISTLEDKTEPTIPWKDVLLSKVEWQSKMRVAGDIKEEKKLAEAMLKAELDGARSRLENAVEYLVKRQSDKSLEKAGEESITRGARYLDAKKVIQYGRAKLKEVAAMEKEGADSTEIARFCLRIAHELESTFEEKAQKIAKRQIELDNLQGYLKELGDHHGVKITAGDEFAGQATTLFQDKIPETWHSPDWELLESLLHNIDAALRNLDVVAKDLEDYMVTISNLEIRFQDIFKIEAELKESYDIVVTPAKEWVAALEAWDKIADLWASGDFDKLEKLLRSFDEPLRKHDYKVRHRLDEANRLAGVNSDQKHTFEKPRKSFIAKEEEPNGRHEIQAPERKLTGNTVWAKGAAGFPIQVDSSYIGKGYELLDESEIPKE